MIATNDLGIEYLTGFDPIGEGGFSVVYAATDTRFDRRVAVKVLAKPLNGTDRRRFDRECRVMGRLSAHPNVVTVHHAGYCPAGSPFLIMELVNGGTLADLIERTNGVPWQDAVDYVIPVSRALAAAHSSSILHRDVKPENILLADGTPKLTDFGIAYLRDATGATSTNVTASLLHTPPETFDNLRDERSDLYSLASTLFTLIAGHAPFWRPGEESLHPLLARLLNEPPPHLSSRLAPEPLARLIDRALAKDPADRPQTCEDFVAALQSIRHGIGPSPSPGGTTRPAAGVVPAPLAGRRASGRRGPTKRRGSTKRQGPTKRRRLLIGLAGAVLAGTAVLAGISGWQPTGDNGRPDTSVAPNDDRSPRIGSEVEEPEEALQDKAPDASADTTAVIFLLQGVPGLEADVYLDGQAIASGSPFGWTEGPFEIEPGEHEIALYRASELPPASAKGRTDEPIQAATLSLGPDVTTVVPHLTQSGAVTVSTFTEPLEAGDAIGPGPPRIAIRHLAAAGEIAMFVNGEFADRLAPGQELVVGVEPGDVLVELRQEESIVVSETLSTTGGGLTTLSWIGGNDDSPTGDLILDRPFRPNPETDG